MKNNNGHTLASPPPTHLSLELEHLIFETAGQLYSIPGDRLIQIIDLPPLTSFPHMPPALRGVMDFRGEAVPLLDLRQKLGHIPLAQELTELIKSLELRKQDHLNWLDKLKDAVYHQREITVETNPHRCAFGRWYDSFKTDSAILEYFLSRFDKPHQRIHQLAIEAQELMQTGQQETAHELIHAAENKELKQLIKLFDNAPEQITNYSYEYAVVVESGEKKMAVVVDALKCFDKFDAITEELPELIAADPNNFIEAIGKRKQEESVEEVMMIQIDNLIRPEMALLAAASRGKREATAPAAPPAEITN